jgi:6-phosphogluconate dehydrogenase
MDTGAYRIGMVGLGVMGRNLALNMADNGFSVVGYDKDPAKIEALNREAEGRPARGVAGIGELAAALRPPGSVMMLVPAGPAVDAVIQEITPHLQPGDIIIDGGNSHYRDTDRRRRALAEHQIMYIGAGISGGEYGARFGPGIMPAGPERGYELVRDIFEAVAAKVDGEPCVAYLGPGSAGHYVKMVHNGIEYALIEMIAESYDLMRRGMGMGNDELYETYDRWNGAALRSYLIEITADIFRTKDTETGRHLVDVILDEAGEKGTGRWTVQDAMDLNVPVPAVDVAVAMRSLSDLRDERRAASRLLAGPTPRLGEGREGFVTSLEKALSACMVIIYAQGMALIRKAALTYGFRLSLAEIARIWRGGCIIGSDLLGPIREAFNDEPDLQNLLINPILGQYVENGQADLRRVTALAATYGVPAPVLASCLAYFDAYRSEWLPANLVQAQRDYFGSHTYRRTDRSGVFHTEWVKKP